MRERERGKERNGENSDYEIYDLLMLRKILHNFCRSFSREISYFVTTSEMHTMCNVILRTNNKHLKGIVHSTNLVYEINNLSYFFPFSIFVTIDINYTSRNILF